MTQLQELPSQRQGRHILIRHEHLVATARTAPHDELSITEILALAPELLHPDDRSDSNAARRRRGALRILRWLSTFPGSGWQERWLNSGADTGVAWMKTLAAQDWRLEETALEEFRMGMGYLLACRVLLPGYGYLHPCKLSRGMSAVRLRITPHLFARAEATAENLGIVGRQQRGALTSLAKIVIHTGKGLDELTEADLFEYRSSQKVLRGVDAAWQILAEMGVLAKDSTMRAALLHGQHPTSELVDSYGIQDRAIRDVLVRYLDERRPGMDYNSFRSLAVDLCRNFWRDIELHHPGISSLHLPAEVATAWKERIGYINLPDGTRRPRKHRIDVLIRVRAFYLDISEWALEDASWAQWAVPSPVRRGDTDGHEKVRRRIRAEIHQRIRERLPQLPVLVDTAEAYWHDRAAMPQKAIATTVGGTFDHNGRTYQRLNYKHNEPFPSWLSPRGFAIRGWPWRAARRAMGSSGVCVGCARS